MDQKQRASSNYNDSRYHSYGSTQNSSQMEYSFAIPADSYLESQKKNAAGAKNKASCPYSWGDKKLPPGFSLIEFEKTIGGRCIQYWAKKETGRLIWHGFWFCFWCAMLIMGWNLDKFVFLSSFEFWTNVIDFLMNQQLVYTASVIYRVTVSILCLLVGANVVPYVRARFAKTWFHIHPDGVDIYRGIFKPKKILTAKHGAIRSSVLLKPHGGDLLDWPEGYEFHLMHEGEDNRIMWSGEKYVEAQHIQHFLNDMLDHNKMNLHQFPYSWAEKKMPPCCELDYRMEEHDDCLIIREGRKDAIKKALRPLIGFGAAWILSFYTFGFYLPANFEFWNGLVSSFDKNNSSWLGYIAFGVTMFLCFIPIKAVINYIKAKSNYNKSTLFNSTFDGLVVKRRIADVEKCALQIPHDKAAIPAEVVAVDKRGGKYYTLKEVKKINPAQLQSYNIKMTGSEGEMLVMKDGTRDPVLAKNLAQLINEMIESKRVHARDNISIKREIDKTLKL